MNKESIQTRRDAFAADMTRNRTRSSEIRGEIAKSQEQLEHCEREYLALNGAVQACDMILNEIHEEESKSAEAANVLAMPEASE